MEFKSTFSRGAFRPNLSVSVKGEGEVIETISSRLTPTQRALDTLSKVLDEFRVSEEEREEYLNIAEKIDTLEFMNMRVLAITFFYLKDYPELSEFSDEILKPYLIKLVESPTQELLFKYKQTLLRYVTKVASTQAELEEEE